MRLPILIYHDIGNMDTSVPSVESDLYSLAPDTFEGHLQSIVRRQVSTLTMEDLIRTGDNGTSRKTGICLTFDDGYLSNYDTVCPLLTQYGLKGSFFITTGQVGWPQRVTWGQLREMSDAGFSIQSHSRTHSCLSSYEPDKLREELRQSKNDLEQHLGRLVIAFAPPYGDWSQHAASIANTCGYQIICTSRPGFNDSPFQFQKLRRFSMRGPQATQNLLAYLDGNRITSLRARSRGLLLRVAKGCLSIKQYHALRSAVLRMRQASRV
jgi:Predicted xylanase/chitin deacetylase